MIMIFIRSLLFFIAQMIWVPVYSMVIVMTVPFDVHTRYPVAIGMAKGLIWLLRVICNIRMEVRGAENIPKEPCVIMSKHQSAWETFALQLIFPKQTYVVKRELLWIPFFGWALAAIRPIAINRSAGKMAIKQLLVEGKHRLNNRFCLVVFPEGTRTRFGERGKYKIGGAMLAVSTGALVSPVAHNAGKHWGRNSFMKYPGTIIMSIGKPINPAGLKPEELNRQVEEWIEGEMERIG